MASILRIPPFLHPPRSKSSSAPTSSARTQITLPSRFSPLGLTLVRLPQPPSSRIPPFSSLTSLPPLAAAPGETTETEEDVQQHQPPSTNNLEDSEDEIQVEECADDGTELDGKAESTIMSLLESFKEALENNDQSKVTEIESSLLSIEDEKESLAKKISLLSEELSVEKDRILRISADFDNFRKRAERERLSLMTNVQGEVVEGLLPVLDNFERAKAQIKIESEGEEKINNSYQNICKQFVEILDSLGVEAVETAGCAFDPMLHEAIMREDSAEFEEGIILEEFRKGFKLGERLLRPAMVKVSAGPGPAKSVEEALPDEEGSNGYNGETSTENDGGEPA